MKRLWMLLFLSACSASPSEPQVDTNYYLTFVKSIDTIYVDVSQKQITETQVTKHIGAITNVRNRRMVLISSDLFIAVTSGFGHIDTVPTVNGISYTNNGYVGTAFGAFPDMVGMTATIIAKIVDDIRTPEEFKYPHLRKVLAVDTARIVILPRK